jgi:hypothetical protein
VLQSATSKFGKSWGIVVRIVIRNSVEITGQRTTGAGKHLLERRGRVLHAVSLILIEACNLNVCNYHERFFASGSDYSKYWEITCCVVHAQVGSGKLCPLDSLEIADQPCDMYTVFRSKEIEL